MRSTAALTVNENSPSFIEGEFESNDNGGILSAVEIREFWAESTGN